MSAQLKKKKKQKKNKDEKGDPVGCVGERIGYPESVHHRSDEDEVERSELGNMGLASASPSDHLTCFYHIQHIHYCIYLYYRIIRHRPYSITVYSNTGEMGRKIWKFSQTRQNHYGRVAARRRPSKRNNSSGKKKLYPHRNRSPQEIFAQEASPLPCLPFLRRSQRLPLCCTVVRETREQTRRKPVAHYSNLK